MHAYATNARPRFRTLFASLPLLLSPAAGCTALQGLQSPSGAYVAADRATYDAVAPEYAAYVAHDASLSDEQRARRDRTVQTWRLRLETAERAAGDKVTR
jgi:hypothetical protein